MPTSLVRGGPPHPPEGEPGAPGEHPLQVDHGGGGEGEVEGADVHPHQVALDHQALPPGFPVHLEIMALCGICSSNHVKGWKYILHSY